MNPASQKMLLPSGVADLLPPEALQLHQTRANLLESFASYGYELVGPPLMEFEESLLGGRGAELSTQTFRVMDPATQRMMGFRPDITLQVARIAQSRMEKIPRPLRLCYSGAVLRVKGEALRNMRERWQAGIELIGSNAIEADIEVIVIAAQALARLGIEGISVDLNLPGLVQNILQQDKDAASLASALERKDSSEIRNSASSLKDVLLKLLDTAGTATTALKNLQALQMPPQAKAQCAQLQQLVTGLQNAIPDLTLTIDPVENRGFEYHTGVSFSLFARGIAQELGRGGRYIIGERNGEPATGFTLYLDTMLRNLPLPKEPPRILVASDTPKETIAKLQGQGYATLFALDGKLEAGQAKQLRCTHIYKNGKAENI